MDLIIVTVMAALIVIAMITLVITQVRRREAYWADRKSEADLMLEHNREWLEAHNVKVIVRHK